MKITLKGSKITKTFQLHLQTSYLSFQKYNLFLHINGIYDERRIFYVKENFSSDL